MSRDALLKIVTTTLALESHKKMTNYWRPAIASIRHIAEEAIAASPPEAAAVDDDLREDAEEVIGWLDDDDHSQAEAVRVIRALLAALAGVPAVDGEAVRWLVEYHWPDDDKPTSDYFKTREQADEYAVRYTGITSTVTPLYTHPAGRDAKDGVLFDVGRSVERWQLDILGPVEALQEIDAALNQDSK